MSNKSFSPQDFEVVELNEEDVKKSLVKRHNIVSEFTYSDVEGHIKDLQKMDTQLSSQVSVCDATMGNIERNHSFLADLTEEQRHHVWMWYENHKVKTEAEEKLNLVQEQLQQYQDILAILQVKLDIDEDEQKGGTTETAQG